MTTPRLIRACRHEVLDRPPVWFMRQAGRYMSEYQAIRSKATFLELCKNVDLATEVSLQPFKAFGVDAVIMFSDILIPPEAMGMSLEFTDGKGPVFHDPLRSVAQLDALKMPDVHESMGFVFEILKQLRRELESSPETALIGFSGAPWTLASYMIEGGTSRNFMYLKQWMYNEPEALHRLLGMLTTLVEQYMSAQIEAGAQMVQLFDTWGGLLDEAGYRTFIQPYEARIIKTLQTKYPDTPVTLYVGGSSHMLSAVAETQPDVLSVDWRTDLKTVRNIVQPVAPNRVLQGNLDPTAMTVEPDVLKGLVETTLHAGGNQNYIFNVGHGLIPQTPRENVQRVVDWVKESAKTPATCSL